MFAGFQERLIATLLRRLFGAALDAPSGGLSLRPRPLGPGATLLACNLTGMSLQGAVFRITSLDAHVELAPSPPPADGSRRISPRTVFSLGGVTDDAEGGGWAADALALLGAGAGIVIDRLEVRVTVKGADGALQMRVGALSLSVDTVTEALVLQLETLQLHITTLLDVEVGCSQPLVAVAALKACLPLPTAAGGAHDVASAADRAVSVSVDTITCTLDEPRVTVLLRWGRLLAAPPPPPLPSLPPLAAGAGAKKTAPPGTPLLAPQPVPTEAGVMSKLDLRDAMAAANGSNADGDGAAMPAQAAAGDVGVDADATSGAAVQLPGVLGAFRRFLGAVWGGAGSVLAESVDQRLLNEAGAAATAATAVVTAAAPSPPSTQSLAASLLHTASSAIPGLLRSALFRTAAPVRGRGSSSAGASPSSGALSAAPSSAHASPSGLQDFLGRLGVTRVPSGMFLPEEGGNSSGSATGNGAGMPPPSRPPPLLADYGRDGGLDWQYAGGAFDPAFDDLSRSLRRPDGTAAGGDMGASLWPGDASVLAADGGGAGRTGDDRLEGKLGVLLASVNSIVLRVLDPGSRNNGEGWEVHAFGVRGELTGWLLAGQDGGGGDAKGEGEEAEALTPALPPRTAYDWRCEVDSLTLLRLASEAPSSPSSMTSIIPLRLASVLALSFSASGSAPDSHPLLAASSLELELDDLTWLPGAAASAMAWVAALRAPGTEAGGSCETATPATATSASRFELVLDALRLSAAATASSSSSALVTVDARELRCAIGPCDSPALTAASVPGAAALVLHTATVRRRLEPPLRRSQRFHWDQSLHTSVGSVDVSVGLLLGNGHGSGAPVATTAPLLRLSLTPHEPDSTEDEEEEGWVWCPQQDLPGVMVGLWLPPSAAAAAAATKGCGVPVASVPPTIARHPPPQKPRRSVVTAVPDVTALPQAPLPPLLGFGVRRVALTAVSAGACSLSLSPAAVVAHAPVVLACISAVMDVVEGTVQALHGEAVAEDVVTPSPSPAAGPPPPQASVLRLRFASLLCEAPLPVSLSSPDVVTALELTLRRGGVDIVLEGGAPRRLAAGLSELGLSCNDTLLLALQQGSGASVREWPAALAVDVSLPPPHTARTARTRRPTASTPRPCLHMRLPGRTRVSDLFSTLECVPDLLAGVATLSSAFGNAPTAPPQQLSPLAFPRLWRAAAPVTAASALLTEGLASLDALVLAIDGSLEVEATTGSTGGTAVLAVTCLRLLARPPDAVGGASLKEATLTLTSAGAPTPAVSFKLRDAALGLQLQARQAVEWGSRHPRGGAASAGATLGTARSPSATPTRVLLVYASLEAVEAGLEDVPAASAAASSLSATLASRLAALDSTPGAAADTPTAVTIAAQPSGGSNGSRMRSKRRTDAAASSPPRATPAAALAPGSAFSTASLVVTSSEPEELPLTGIYGTVHAPPPAVPPAAFNDALGSAADAVEPLAVELPSDTRRLPAAGVAALLAAGAGGSTLPSAGAADFETVGELPGGDGGGMSQSLFLLRRRDAGSGDGGAEQDGEEAAAVTAADVADDAQAAATHHGGGLTGWVLGAFLRSRRLALPAWLAPGPYAPSLDEEEAEVVTEDELARDAARARGVFETSSGWRELAALLGQLVTSNAPAVPDLWEPVAPLHRVLPSRGGGTEGGVGGAQTGAPPSPPTSQTASCAYALEAHLLARRVIAGVTLSSSGSRFELQASALAASASVGDHAWPASSGDTRGDTSCSRHAALQISDLRLIDAVPDALASAPTERHEHILACRLYAPDVQAWPAPVLQLAATQVAHESEASGRPQHRLASHLEASLAPLKLSLRGRLLEVVDAWASASSTAPAAPPAALAPAAAPVALPLVVSYRASAAIAATELELNVTPEGRSIRVGEALGGGATPAPAVAVTTTPRGGKRTLKAAAPVWQRLGLQAVLPSEIGLIPLRRLLVRLPQVPATALIEAAPRKDSSEDDDVFSNTDGDEEEEEEEEEEDGAARLSAEARAWAQVASAAAGAYRTHLTSKELPRLLAALPFAVAPSVDEALAAVRRHVVGAGHSLASLAATVLGVVRTAFGNGAGGAAAAAVGGDTSSAAAAAAPAASPMLLWASMTHERPLGGEVSGGYGDDGEEGGGEEAALMEGGVSGGGATADADDAGLAPVPAGNADLVRLHLSAAAGWLEAVIGGAFNTVTARLGGEAGLAYVTERLAAVGHGVAAGAAGATAVLRGGWGGFGRSDQTGGTPIEEGWLLLE